MDLERAREYRSELSQTLKLSQNRDERRLLLQSERQQPIYWEAKQTKKLGRPLTEEEEVSLWAYQKADQYDQLPKATSADRKRVATLVQEVSHELIAHPKKITTAGAVWKSQQERQGKTDSFYRAVQERSQRWIRENWQKVTTKQLADLVKAHSYGDITTDFTAALLEAFFKGPDSVPEAAKAFYIFTDAALELVSDQTALEEAVKIGLFDSPILARGSRFWNLINLARVALDDDKLLQRAYIADNIITQLCVLTSLDREALIRTNKNFMLATTRHEAWYSKRVEEMSLRTIRAFGEEGYRLRAESYRRSSINTATFVADPDKFSDYVKRWPLSILYDTKDPLRAKYLQQAAPGVAGERIRQVATGEFQHQEGQPPIIFTMPLPKDKAADIYVSGALNLRDKAALIKQIIQDLNSHQKQIDSVLESPSKYPEAVIAGYAGAFNGLTYYWNVRGLSSPERLRHPLSALEQIGFPVPVFPEGDNILIAIRRVHQQLLNGQSRYLNSRGYRVPLADRSFRNLGYRDMTFYQDTDNLYASRVEIEVNGLIYPLRLDRSFNLNLEGKILNNPPLERCLHYSALFLLSRILCEYPTQAQARPMEQPILEQSAQTRTQETPEQLLRRVRIGYLRWLPEGHFTQRAALIYAAETGNDLSVMQSVRWQQHPDKIGQATTYVSPVWRAGEPPKPIVVHIPHIDGF